MPIERIAALSRFVPAGRVRRGFVRTRRNTKAVKSRAYCVDDLSRFVPAGRYLRVVSQPSYRRDVERPLVPRFRHWATELWNTQPYAPKAKGADQP